MHALAPGLISRGDASGRGGREADDLEAEPVDQAFDLLADVAPCGDDERLGDSAGGDQQIILGPGPPGLLEEHDEYHRRFPRSNQP